MGKGSARGFGSRVRLAEREWEWARDRGQGTAEAALARCQGIGLDEKPIVWVVGLARLVNMPTATGHESACGRSCRVGRSFLELQLGTAQSSGWAASACRCLQQLE